MIDQRAVGLFALFLLWLPAAASSGELQRLVDERAQELVRIERLIEALSQEPLDHHDAIRFRLDQRLLSLWSKIDGTLLGRAATSDAEQNRELFELSKSQVRRILELSLMRIDVIDQRIALARTEINEFEEGMKGNIAESFIQEQQLLQLRYLRNLMQALSALSELSVEAQEVTAGLRPWLEDKILLMSDRLTGQIRLDATKLLELRSRAAEDPLDQGLATAIRAVQRKQTRSLNTLDATIRIMGQLGLDTADYRALVLQQRGVIGVEILQIQVFMRVLRDRLEALQQTLVSTGPNLILRGGFFVAIMVFAWLLARAVRLLLRWLLQLRQVNITQLSSDVLISVSGIVTFLIGILVALATLGISVTPMLAGLGVAGIILGFALQDSLSNLASGAMILLYQPYDVDDHVCVGTVEGVVKKMNLVATTITTFDNQVLVVPNKNIWGDNIINHTASRVRRVDIEVSVSYEEDLDYVEQVLMEEIQANESVLPMPAPVVHIGRWNESAVTMMTKSWVKTPNYWLAMRALTKRFKQRFDDEGISIPYPQRDIHVYQHGGPPEKPQRRSKAPDSDRG